MTAAQDFPCIRTPLLVHAFLVRSALSTSGRGRECLISGHGPKFPRARIRTSTPLNNDDHYYDSLRGYTPLVTDVRVRNRERHQDQARKRRSSRVAQRLDATYCVTPAARKRERYPAHDGTAPHRQTTDTYSASVKALNVG